MELKDTTKNSDKSVIKFCFNPISTLICSLERPDEVFTEMSERSIW